jgi:hypothetical protein
MYLPLLIKFPIGSFLHATFCRVLQSMTTNLSMTQNLHLFNRNSPVGKVTLVWSLSICLMTEKYLT